MVRFHKFSVIQFVVLLTSVLLLSACGPENGNTLAESRKSTIASLLISPQSTAIPAGKEVQYQVMAVMSNGTSKNVTDKVKWEVSDNSLLSIDPSTAKGKALIVGDVLVTAEVDGVKSPAARVAILNSMVVSLSVEGCERIVLGDAARCTAFAYMTDGSKANVTGQSVWTINNESIAEVDYQIFGQLNSKNVGRTTVNANLSGLQASLDVEVVPAEVRQIQITPASVDGVIGFTYQYEAKGIYSDGTTRDVTTEVEWVATDGSVGTVSPSGLLTTIGSGDSLINAKKDGITSNTSSVKVSNIQLVSMQFSPPTINLPVGPVENVTLVGTFNDGSTRDMSDVSTVQYSFSDASVATREVRNSQAVMLGLKQGATIAKASFNGVDSNDINVNIVNATLESISISPDRSEGPQGIEQAYTALGQYSDQSIYNVTNSVNWNTNDAAIASITSYGVLSAKSKGVAYITASYNSSGTLIESNQVEFIVTDAEIVSLSITPTSATLPLGDSFNITYTAIAELSDGRTIDVSENGSLVWHTKDDFAWAGSGNNVSEFARGNFKPNQLTGVNRGTNIAYATIAKIRSNDSNVSVLDATVVDLEISTQNVETIAGHTTTQFFATALLSDGSKSNVTSTASWQVDDLDTGFINAVGMLSGVVSDVWVTKPITITTSLPEYNMSRSLDHRVEQDRIIELRVSSNIVNNLTPISRHKVKVEGRYYREKDLTNWIDVTDRVTMSTTNGNVLSLSNNYLYGKDVGNVTINIQANQTDKYLKQYNVYVAKNDYAHFQGRTLYHGKESTAFEVTHKQPCDSRLGKSFAVLGKGDVNLDILFLDNPTAKRMQNSALYSNTNYYIKDCAWDACKRYQLFKGYVSTGTSSQKGIALCNHDGIIYEPDAP
ncbi:Ig-like domain-containing protein [Vibrio cholerae]